MPAPTIFLNNEKKQPPTLFTMCLLNTLTLALLYFLGYVECHPFIITVPMLIPVFLLGAYTLMLMIIVAITTIFEWIWFGLKKIMGK